MRKLISAISIIALLLSLVACGETGTPADTTGSTDTEAPAMQIGENDIVVSPDGDDSGDGTAAHPLASLSAAKEMAKKAPEGAEVTVWLRGGRYQLTDGIVFDETDRAGVTYSAYGNEKPVLSFGTPITGWTTTSINSVKAWSAKVPEDVDIAMLSSDNEILPMSRYPDEGFLKVKWFDYDDVKNEESKSGKRTKSFVAYDEDVTTFQDAEHIILMAQAPGSPWNVASSPVESIDLETGIITLKYRTGYSFQPESEYFLMNVRVAVKNPGEWYFDRENHLVYYIPRAGEEIEDFVLYAAGGSGDIMSINGVDNITFRGITFRDSERDDNLSSGGQTCTTRPKAINIDHTDGIVFDSCEFRCIGRNAVEFNEDNQNGVVTNCVFSGIGMVALFVSGTNVPNDSPVVTKNFTITNNLVENFGILCHSGSGICVRYVDTADISNNEIHDGNYTGISVGWTWEHGENPTQNISVKDNLIYNIGYGITRDMGGIYTLGEQKGTVISGNVVHHVENVCGIYLDQGASFMTVENNLVYKAGNAFQVTGTCDSDILRNNIAAYSGIALNIGPKFIEYDHSLETYNNIFTTCGEMLYNSSEEDFAFDSHNDFYFDYSGKNADEYVIPSCAAEPSITDPLFADPENFDFTLSESSPAVAGGFEIWDYSRAGRK